MAQGKLKVKTQLPQNIKKSSVHRGVQKKKSKVMNKKSKPSTYGQKLQQEVTKEINKTIESEARSMAQKFGDSSAKIDRKTLKQQS